MDQLYATYMRIVGDLASFLQEIPADLLLQADYVELNPPIGMTDTEVRAYSNGVRYAATVVATAITAKMASEQAEFEGEFNAGKNLEGENT